MNRLRARFRMRQGAFALDVDLDVVASGVTGLFGRSGAGKTTLLRCLAGLERAPVGTLSLRGEVWQDEARGRFVPPWRRGVGYVVQEAALFPHLDVRRNLAYGMRRIVTAKRRIRFDDVVAWLRLEDLLQRRPDGLSGGERQRVAIGRALLASPSLLLLDEPLAALDEQSRREILPFLEELPRRHDVPTILVTHSLREVARLCDRVVVLDAGTVRSTDSITEFLASLDTAADDADSIGCVLDATVVAHHDLDALTELRAAGAPWFVRRVDHEPGARVRVLVPARDVSLALDQEPRSSILNVLVGHVQDLRDVSASQVLVRVLCGTGAEHATVLARITRRSARALGLVPGLRVHARVKSVGLLE